ncbi:MAG: hypothetical protein MJZ67_05340 [Bacteroidales bacterium]|nr:hypothetical protein [Bacteroidales bacterium]
MANNNTSIQSCLMALLVHLHCFVAAILRQLLPWLDTEIASPYQQLSYVPSNIQSTSFPPCKSGLKSCGKCETVIIYRCRNDGRWHLGFRGW